MSSNHIVCVWTPSWLAATFFTLCLDGENSSADGRDITPMQLLTGWEDLQRTHTPRRCGCVHADTQFPSVRCLFYHKCSASTEMDFPSEACKVWLPLASRYCSFKAPTCNMFVCLFVCLFALQAVPDRDSLATFSARPAFSLGSMAKEGPCIPGLVSLAQMISNTFSKHSKRSGLYLPSLFIKDVPSLSPGEGVVANAMFIKLKDVADDYFRIVCARVCVCVCV